MTCLMIAHNDCVHAVNGISPAEVILGRHLNLPGQELVEEPLNGYNPRSYAQKLKWILAKTQEIVQGQMVLKLQRNEHKSQGIKTTEFKVGQAVRMWQPTTLDGKKAKLLQKWFGPYFINEIKSQGRVIYLKDSEGIQLPLPVSVNRIWPYPEGLIRKDVNDSMQMDIDEKHENERAEHSDSGDESSQSF